MSIQTNQLLQRLAGLALGRVGPGAQTAPASGDAAGFESLLRRAVAGEGGATTDLPVGLDPGLDLELTDDQSARLAAAADSARAQGLDRALVMLDGHALVLDVESRRVVARVEPGGAVALSEADVDGIVAAPIGAEPATITAPRETAPHVRGPQTPAGTLLGLLDRAWARPNGARHAAR